MTLTKTVSMDAPSLNGDTHVGQDDPTPKARQPMPVQSIAREEMNVAATRGRGRSQSNDLTETMPRLPSQKFVDWAYFIGKVGRITAFFFIIAPTCMVAMPWVGTNVVIPIVNAATLYVGTQAEISKSLVTISQDSVKVSAASLEQNKKVEEKLDHFTARLDASIEVQKDVAETLKKINQKPPGDSK